MEKNKNFIYGIAVVKFGSATIGWIEKGSWDWGGTKPESVDVEAEQVPDAPVLTLCKERSDFPDVQPYPAGLQEHQGRSWRHAGGLG